jgi:hypothetical protein
MKRSLFTRRSFLAGTLASAPLARGLSLARGLVAPTLLTTEPGKSSGPQNERARTALELRQQAAIKQSKRPLAPMVANGDEDSLPDRIACFAKGLRQNQFGEADPGTYNALVAAIKSGKFSDFEGLPRGGGKRLSNPQSAYTFHTEGGDPHSFSIPPAPSIATSAATFETSELYWQSLCRDVPFLSYEASPIIQQAAKHLGTTPSAVFRGSTKSDLTGPYVSQFLLKPIPYGSAKIDQLYSVPVPGTDFMTTLNEWSQIQAGLPPWREASYDSVRRYIRNGRDLAEYVHYDFSYQAYLNAALILVNAGPKSILNCNAFKSPSNPYRYSTIEEGFATFGPPEAFDWLGRVTTAALKASYCQKWMVHRRLRPEALGGLIHQTRTGSRNYPIHATLLESEAVDAVHARTGSYLLPQAYPEGCPLHPSYPAGHAAIAGACSVVLKACFDSSMLLPGCVEASADGLTLTPCFNYSPTVGEEIDKLAFNIGMGRDWAGIHYRSDQVAGLQLGEDVAISILQDLACTYTEEFKGFSFKRYDGREVGITPQGEVVQAGVV